MEHTYDSVYFYGNKISRYGIEHGYVDYAALASAFDAVLNNNILAATKDIGFWEPFNGCEYYYENADGVRISEEDYYDLSEEEQEEFEYYEGEVYQWFIIDDRGAEILQEMTDEIVYYNEELDMYVWGITHYGTAWSHVLTNIRLKLDESAKMPTKTYED